MRSNALLYFLYAALMGTLRIHQNSRGGITIDFGFGDFFWVRPPQHNIAPSLAGQFFPQARYGIGVDLPIPGGFGSSVGVGPGFSGGGFALPGPP